MSLKQKKATVNNIALTQSEIDFYHEYGYLAIPGFIDTPMVEKIKEEVLTALEEIDVPLESLNGSVGSAGNYLPVLNIIKIR